MTAWLVCCRGSRSDQLPFICIQWDHGSARVAVLGEHEANRSKAPPSVWRAYLRQVGLEVSAAWALMEWSAWAEQVRSISDESELLAQLEAVRLTAPDVAVIDADTAGDVGPAGQLSTASRDPLHTRAALALDDLCRTRDVAIHLDSEVVVLGRRCRPDFIVEVDKASPQHRLILAETKDRITNLADTFGRILAIQQAVPNPRAVASVLFTSDPKAYRRSASDYGIRVVDPWSPHAHTDLAAALEPKF